MDVSLIKDILTIAAIVASALGSIVGAIWWLNSVWNAIKENKILREKDKEELLGEISKLHTKVDRVELETKHQVEKTHGLFSEIKEQIARLEGKIEVFFSNK